MNPLKIFLVSSITAATAVCSGAEPPLEIRGTTYFVYTASEGETVRIDVRPRISSVFASALPGFQVLDQDSRQVQDKRAFSEAMTIEYRAEETGIHALVLEAKRHWCEANFGGRPFMICAKPEQPIHFRKTPGPLYFHVPAGADRIELAFCCPDKREGGTLRVRSPDGAVRLEKTDWFHEPTRLHVAVAEAQRGREWSIETEDPRRHGAPYAIDDVLVYLAGGALPFVGRSPEDLRRVLVASGELSDDAR